MDSQHLHDLRGDVCRYNAEENSLKCNSELT